MKHRLAAMALALAPALAGGAVCAQGAGLALSIDTPAEAFGELSYYDAWSRRDPEQQIPPPQWTSCWAFIKAEYERLRDLARNGPAGYREELNWAAINYQVAMLNYNELIRGTAIHEGMSNAELNAQFEIEEQSLIGGQQQWLSSNAAECIYQMPDRDMPEFAELYPWLGASLGTGHQ